MPFYQMSLQCFQQILSVRSCDITPLSHLLLSDDAEQLMQQLEQLKAAIEGSTRVIAAFILVRKNADLIVEKADSIIFSMYHQLIAALKEKATMQLYLKRIIKQHPYGPYADLFRAPDSPHDDFGRIFSPREIAWFPYHFLINPFAIVRPIKCILACTTTKLIYLNLIGIDFEFD